MEPEAQEVVVWCAFAAVLAALLAALGFYLLRAGRKDRRSWLKIVVGFLCVLVGLISFLYLVLIISFFVFVKPWIS